MASGEFNWVTKVQNATAVLYVFILYFFFKICELGIVSICLSYFITETINLILGYLYLKVNLFLFSNNVINFYIIFLIN